MKKIGAFAFLISLPLVAGAQTSFEEFRNQARAGLEQFRNKSREEFEAFRKKINEDYASFLSEAWNPSEQKQTPPPPVDPTPPVPPVVYEPDPVVEADPEPEPHPIEIKRVIVTPQPTPSPTPVAPLPDDIKPNLDLIPIKGVPVPKREPMVAVRYLGTPVNVRWDKSTGAFRLSSVKEQSVADTWRILSDGRADKLLRDCLDLRKRLELSDWAYINLLKDVGEAVAGKNSNEAVILMAWLYCQSGYKMRLATSSSQLYMLYASDHLIYSQPYYRNGDDFLYAFNCNESNLNISGAQFPEEKPLSLIIASVPNLTANLSEPRILKSKRYGTQLTSQSNKNLIDFYNTYPTSYINGDIMTRWAMYANVPASAEFKEYLYPELSKAVEGKSKRDGTEILLNWVQTAFPYEYDEVIWGEDRAFFADESLYYPACDCEDRSILFSRLVRDLLDIDVMLVYYPGHLATAVAFTDETEPRGDYINFNGQRFTICDPTYINAGTGRTMPGMDNSSAQVIPLQR